MKSWRSGLRVLDDLQVQFKCNELSPFVLHVLLKFLVNTSFLSGFWSLATSSPLAQTFLRGATFSTAQSKFCMMDTVAWFILEIWINSFSIVTRLFFGKTLWLRVPALLWINPNLQTGSIPNCLSSSLFILGWAYLSFGRMACHYETVERRFASNNLKSNSFQLRWFDSLSLNFFCCNVFRPFRKFPVFWEKNSQIYSLPWYCA